jgi:hypothetical protein
MKSKAWIAIYYMVLFSILYFSTLNLNYVEGDDAATVLYHLCGRDAAIQKPYAAYNSGLDYIIQASGLVTEQDIRSFAILVSFVCGLLLLLGCKAFLEVFFENSNYVSAKNRMIFYVLLPFIIPDILFHSLIVNASNISFVFFIYSLVYFIKFLKKDTYPPLALAIVLLAIAIPFRWTMLVALPVYLGLIVYFKPLTFSKESGQLLLKIFSASLLGLALSLYFIAITGYDLQGIIATIKATTGYLSDLDNSVLSILASASAFITPPLCLLLLLTAFKIRAIYKEMKIFYRLTGLVVLSISPFFLFGFFPAYKYLMTVFPILLLLMMFGFDYMMQNKISKTLFGLSLLFIWFVGIQINATGTFCGPGFELNTQKVRASSNANDNKERLNDRVKLNGANLKLDAGFYMPMAEGPRSLYGYYYMFFCKGWYNQIESFTNERNTMVKQLIKEKNLIFIQDRRTAYVSCDLYHRGYQTKTDFQDMRTYLFRDFIKGKDTIKLHVIPDDCSKMDWISNFKAAKNKKVMFRSSYSSEILHLYQNKKGAIQLIGPFTALVN